MKPLLKLVLCGISLALVATAMPSLRGPLLDAAVATAWAQQDRGRADKDKDRDQRDKDRNSDKDRDSDRGAGKDKERDTDRGVGTDKERDTDRGGGNDKERDTDRGVGTDKERDTDRGGGKDKERDTDRGGSNDKGRDTDRGGKNQDRPDRNNNQGRDNNTVDRGGNTPDATDKGSNNTGSGAGGRNDNGAATTGVADRDSDPADRIPGDARDRDAAPFAGRFDLDDTETFDNDGFLARRGEIIAMSTDALLRRRAEALGLSVVQQEFLASLNTTMYRLAVPAASPIDGILARLRAQDPAGVFDRNHLYDRSASAATSPSGTPSRALVGTAKGVSIGLIDTGVDALHPALSGTHVELQYFVDQSRELPETHGTAVVSLLVSREYGILPDAQLYVACVFYEDRRGGALSEARDLVRALDWLMKRRVPVINMSLAGPPNQVLEAAVKRALAAGHLIVAAVGNGGPASPPLYPAAYEGVIAVTAIDGTQHVYRRANRGQYVQLAAMGVDVLAAAPAGVASYSGTSFASPYVAALAAMDYRELDPQKALQVKESLRDNALDLGPPGRDEVYGYGLARPRPISTVAR